MLLAAKAMYYTAYTVTTLTIWTDLFIILILKFEQVNFQNRSYLKSAKWMANKCKHQLNCPFGTVYYKIHTTFSGKYV